MSPHAHAGVYTFFQVTLWTIGLPALVLSREVGSLTPVWRPWLSLVLAAVAGLSGLALVFGSAAVLSKAGVGVFGIAPGPALVDDGPYGFLRHPVDAGIVLLAAAPALALGLRQVWIVPLAALIYLVVGYEPVEERRLAEEFGDEYEEYRQRVARWFPRSPD